MNKLTYNNYMYLSLLNPKIWIRTGYLVYSYLPIIGQIWWSGLNNQPIMDKLKKTINQTGPVFIKLTQWLIQRPELLNVQTAQSLRSLQSKCQPSNLNDLLTTVDLSLGYSHQLLITDISPEPIGVGSMAQVHKANMINDQKTHVIIKIRHPGIIDLIQLDLTIIYWLIKLLYWTKFKDMLNVLNIEKVLNNIYKQADLKNEKNHLDSLNKVLTLKKKINVYLPTMILAHNDFLIETYCPGVHINQLKSNPKHYLEARSLLLDSYLKMIKHHHIHGDLHDGNVLCHVNSLGKLEIYLVDFGLIVDLLIDDNIAFRDLILGYMYFYSKNNPDPILKSIQKLTHKILTEIELNHIKDLLLSNSKLINGVRLFTTPMLITFIENLFKFFKQNQIFVKDNILYALITLSNIEAGISNEYRIDFFKNKNFM